ncbi:MAG TPA: SbmA/BacA-like family transporter [Gemmataceae bacterium]|nr:SbmA/BacA-like family transporter [Gemmataceae bacterium]
MPRFGRQLGSRMAAVGRPFFRAHRAAWWGVGLLVVLLLGINGLNLVNSYVGRDFMSALAERHVHRFYVFAGIWAAVFACSTAVEVLSNYTQQRMGLWWRDWLTQHFLDRYLAGRCYRRLAEHHDVDNPDQRISEDVKTFTASSLSFFVLLVNGLLTLLGFITVLWSITPWLVATAVLYAVCGTLGTFLLGHRLVGLDNQQLRKEADFRYSLVQVRDHAVGVAEVCGEGEERGRLGTRLGALIANYRRVIDVGRNLSFFTTAYNYLPQLIPIVVVAPLFISRRIEFGTVTQSAMAFSQVLGAFSLLITQFQNLSAYAAVTRRLGSLWEATEPPPPAAAPAPTGPTAPEGEPAPAAGGPHVVYEGLTLRTGKKGRVLLRDLSLEVPEGKRLLVTGPNGAGKTALFRATAGLWQWVEGRVERPGPKDVLFLPERPHVVPGRLRDLLEYGLDREGLSDAHVLAVLRDVGLGAVVSRMGGLDAERDWPNVLSAGEQRALAFARLLLARPRFAFIDDAAGELDAHRLKRLYQALARSPITYVSAGDQPVLCDFHDLRLDLRGDGSWRVTPAKAAVPAGNGNGHKNGNGWSAN